MQRRTTLAIACLILLTVSALAVWLQRPGEILAPDPDASWEVVDLRQLDTPGDMGLLDSMSPDGRWLLGEYRGTRGGQDPRLVCFWETTSMERSCPAEEIARDSSMRYSWAPDSSVVAINNRTEASAPILLVSPQNGTVERLREPPAGAGESLFGRVTWAPDGQRLAFAQGADDERATIVVLERVDGAVREVDSWTAPDEMSVFDDLVWANEETLVFTGEDADDFQGVWRIQVDGSDTRRLVKIVDSFIFPVIHDVSPDGRYLITDAPGDGDPDNDAEAFGTNRYIVYDLETSEVVLELPRTYRNIGGSNLVLTLDPEVELTQERPPRFLPDGDVMLVVSADPDDADADREWGLVQVEVESGRLFVIDQIPGFPDAWQRGGVLEDGTMPLWIDEDRQTLVTLAPSG